MVRTPLKTDETVAGSPQYQVLVQLRATKMHQTTRLWTYLLKGVCRSQMFITSGASGLHARPGQLAPAT